MGMSIKMDRMIKEIDAADINEVTDIVLLAAMRMHELVASDAMKRAEIVLHGTHIETGIKHTVRITRDN